MILSGRVGEGHVTELYAPFQIGYLLSIRIIQEYLRFPFDHIVCHLSSHTSFPDGFEVGSCLTESEYAINYAQETSHDIA